MRNKLLDGCVIRESWTYRTCYRRTKLIPLIRTMKRFYWMARLANVLQNRHCQFL